MRFKFASKINIIFFLSIIFNLLVYDSLASQINLRIEENSGKSVPARVLLRAADGECHHPEDAVLLEIGPDIWFMSDGNSQLELPAGLAELRIERGKEYIRVKEQILIPEDSILTKTVRLKRWINMKERGYLSGENHLHRSPEDIAALCAAEDLNFGSVLQWWNSPRFTVENTGTHIRNLQFGKATIPTTIYDIEIEKDWGALYILNNPRPFSLPVDSDTPNLIAAQYGRKIGTINCYQAGWSREVLLDALLGYVDVVNVCNNNFHMHRFQPRSRYSNLLEVDGFPSYPDTPEGMMKMNTDTYYRLLNCGLKLAAGAGSATGAKQVPAGYNRAYVRCSPNGSITEYLAGLKRGQNFVTNGPMLFFKSIDGLQPGDSIHISGDSQAIEFEIEVMSDSPLHSVEIIKNGKVIKQFQLESGQNSLKGQIGIEISESSWLCARCTDQDMLLSDDELEKYRSPRVKLNQDPSRLRFAHTSPIYIYINKKNISEPQSLSEAQKMLDAFEIFAKENVGSNFYQKMMESIQKARIVLNPKHQYLNPK